MFTPVRLWLSSANFTAGSRRNLEFGVWTEDSKLVAAARRYIVGLVGLSEPLGSTADHPARSWRRSHTTTRPSPTTWLRSVGWTTKKTTAERVGRSPNPVSSGEQTLVLGLRRHEDETPAGIPRVHATVTG